MTLDEMIKQEQENAQNNVQTQVSTSQNTTQTQTASTAAQGGQTSNTVASSNDEKVDR